MSEYSSQDYVRTEFKREILSDVRKEVSDIRKREHDEKVREEERDEEVRKEEVLLNTERLLSLNSVLAVAAIIAGFGYAAYGYGGEDRLRTRRFKLIAIPTGLFALLM